MGAKNHAIILPDCDKEDAMNGVIGACFGSAGQRCMAISVVVLVGDSADLIPEIVAKTAKLSIGPGNTNADICPMNNKKAVERAKDIITKSEG